MAFGYLGLSVIEVSSSSAISGNGSIHYYGGVEMSSGDNEKILSVNEWEESSPQWSAGSGVGGGSD